MADAEGAEDPEAVVSASLVKELMALEHPGPLEARLVIEVRHRAIDSRRARERRVRLHDRAADEPGASSLEGPPEDTSDDNLDKLGQLRNDSIQRSTFVGIAEEYAANCARQKRPVNPVVSEQLRAYEIAMHCDGAYAGALLRETKEKIDRRREKVAKFYRTLFVAIVTVLMWRVGKASAQLLPRTARGWFALVLCILIAIAGLLFVLGRFDEGTTSDSEQRSEAVSAPDRRAESKPSSSESSSAARASRATKSKLAAILATCHELSDDYEIKKCIIEQGDSHAYDLALARALYESALAFDYDPTGLGKRGQIPEDVLSDWQDVIAHKRLSALLSSRGMYAEALLHQREATRTRRRVREEASSVVQELLTFSEDCHVLLELESRVNGPASAVAAHEACWQENPYPSSFNTEDHVFALGAAYADAGLAADALDAFVCVGRSSPMGGAPTGFRLPVSDWQRLFLSADAARQQAADRIAPTLNTLQRDERAFLGGDVAVWTRQLRGGAQLIGTTYLGYRSGWTCGILKEVDMEPRRTEHQMRMRVNTGGHVVAAPSMMPMQNWCYPRSAAWYGETAVGTAPVLLEFQIEAPSDQVIDERQVCRSNKAHRRLRFCLFPDGRVSDASRCK